MNRIQKQRLGTVVSIILLLGIAAGLILYALKQNINLFYTPSQLLETRLTLDKNLRVAGYVKNKSVVYDNSGKSVRFIITDRTNEINVDYQGVLPNLFREGQTVVITGKLINKQTVLASEVLAKHDEKYMPKPLRDLEKGKSYGA